MTVDSYSSSTVINLVVLGLALVMVGAAASIGVLKFNRSSRRGPLIIALGVLIPALFHITDLLTLHTLPLMVGQAKSALITQYLHLGSRWLTPILALLLVFWGLLVTAREQKRSEASLRLNQSRLNEAQRIASVGNWDWDIVADETWWSEEVYRMFQIEPKASGPTFEEFLERIHPEDRQSLDDAVQRALSGEETFSIDHRIALPDGTQRVVHVQGEVAVDEEGQAVRMVGTVHDITDRKRAEEDIRHRAEYQALLLEVSAQLIGTPPRKISQEMIRCLERIGNEYDLDSISMWWLTEEGDSMRTAHRWERIQGRQPPDFRSRAEYPWISKHLAVGKSIVVDDVEQMPPQAIGEQEIFRRWGTKSFLIIPLLIDEKIEGTFVFAVIREKRAWSAQIVAEFKLLSENLASAYARSQAMVRIEQLKDQLQEENIYLREEVRLAHGFAEIIGENDQLKRSLQAVEKVAPTDVTVLIQGETGTGKELIARAVHNLSGRRDQPMVSVNCPALPTDLIESELFGHEKGAFTGAQALRKGRFELANGGTLFLDELAELPLELQGKLLRVLQTGAFERLGGTETLHSDVRLVTATNRDLKQAVDNGEFRADLYYRINSFPIRLPPLRERRDDIPLLAEHFVRKHAERLGKQINAISSRMMKQLMEHSWPGNIRELEGVIERALISTGGGPVLELLSPLKTSAAVPATMSALSQIDRADLTTVERSHIVTVLEQTEWMIAGENGAASKLGMPPSTLRSKMKRLGISRESA